MNIFKELRKKQKLTQVELAKLLNLNQTTVGKWENEKALPDYQTLINLSKLYNVSIDYLLGNTNELTTTTQNAVISPEQAKEIWFSTLAQSDQETINLYLMLNLENRFRVNGYIVSALSKQ